MTSIPLWRRKWQPTPVFLPGESHGRRSLVDYSPRGRKESDTTERNRCTAVYSLMRLLMDTWVCPVWGYHEQSHYDYSSLSLCYGEKI